MFINSLIVGLVISLIGTYTTYQNQNNIEPSDYYVGASYIEDHLEDFVGNVNQELCTSDSKFYCNYIENKIVVNVLDDENYSEGILLDFDESNGYLLLTDNFNILNFELNGESPFKGIVATEYYYSIYGGYFYKLDGEIISVKQNANNEREIFDETKERKHIDGQLDDKTGNGCIYDPDTYIQSYYGNSYKLVASKSLLMKRYDQFDLSCYIFNDYSEGNCGLVSAYHVLQFLQKSRWDSMPSSSNTTLYDPYIYEPDLYFKRFDLTGKPLYEGLRKQDNSVLEQWPELYKVTRMHCASKYGTVENLTVNQTSAIIENVAKMYDYTVDAQEEVMYKLHLDKGINNLNNNTPLCYSVSNDETYGSHTMAVCGYRKYQGKKKIMFFDTVDTVLLYELADGWQSDDSPYRKIYYDMSITNTIGALVFMKF